jgi:hypothetical protein
MAVVEADAGVVPLEVDLVPDPEAEETSRSSWSEPSTRPFSRISRTCRAVW